MRKIAAIAALAGLALAPIGVALAQQEQEQQQQQQQRIQQLQQQAGMQGQAYLPPLDDPSLQAGKNQTLTGRLVDLVDFVVLENYGEQAKAKREQYQQKVKLPKEDFTTKPSSPSNGSAASQQQQSGQANQREQQAGQPSQPGQPAQAQPGQPAQSSATGALAQLQTPKSLEQIRHIGFMEEQSWAQKVFTGRDNFVVIFDPALDKEKQTWEQQVIPHINQRVQVNAQIYEREGFKVMRIKSVTPVSDEAREIGSAKK